jgi:hypothetical protein
LELEAWRRLDQALGGAEEVRLIVDDEDQDVVDGAARAAALIAELL